MSHITSLGAAIFTDMSVSLGTVSSVYITAGTTLPATPSVATNWVAAFATENGNALSQPQAPTAFGSITAATFMRIPNVREFPQVGTPANIVNVAEFGTKQSKTVQGQADAPSLELTVNFIPALWEKGSASTNTLGNLVGDGNLHLFRFTLLASDSTGATAATKYASLTAGLGTVANSQYFWMGKIEALLVKPDLKDTVSATITLSIQSDFYGAFTST